MGRFGNVFLVNGEPHWRITAKRGEVVRFLFTNVSNTRTLNLSFPGAKMKLIASDAGNYEHEEWAESVVIAPAERYVVHVRFDKPGDPQFICYVFARGLPSNLVRRARSSTTLNSERRAVRSCCVQKSSGTSATSTDGSSDP